MVAPIQIGVATRGCRENARGNRQLVHHPGDVPSALPLAFCRGVLAARFAGPIDDKSIKSLVNAAAAL
jgi:hypothetical protein